MKSSFKIVAMSNDVQKNNPLGGLPKEIADIVDVFRVPAEKAGNRFGDAISKIIDSIVVLFTKQ